MSFDAIIKETVNEFKLGFDLKKGQKDCMEQLLEGYDVMGILPTGTNLVFYG